MSNNNSEIQLFSETSKKLRQSVKFTFREAVSYSAFAQTVWDYVHAQINKNSGTTFVVKRSDIEKITGKQTNSRNIREAIDQIHKTNLYIEDLDFSASLFSSWTQVDGDTFVVGMDKDLKSCFVNINIEEGYSEHLFIAKTNIKNKHAKRLYEILSGYKGMGTVKLTLEGLKKKLGIINPETGKDSYKTWSVFKRDVLDVAMEQITECSDLNVSYSVGKKGLKVNIIFFTIIKKPFATQLKMFGENPQVINMNKELVILTTQFKLSTQQAIKFLNEYKYEEEKDTLYKLYCIHKSPSNNPNAKRINNLGGYIVAKYKLS